MPDHRITLDNGILEAEIAPQLGARVCTLKAHDGNVDLLVPLHKWDAPEHGWPKAGAYPLIPYSNRIVGARLNFGNEIHALKPHPLDLPNSLHGHAQRRAWQLASHTVQRAELVLHSEASEDWPWPFEARIVFTLNAAALDVTLALRNTGTRAMPAGLGWHPFLAVDSTSTVHFQASRRWQLDPAFVPTGASFPISGVTELTPNDWQDRDCAIYASEWNGSASITRTGGTVRLATAAPLTHLVAYAPRSGSFCCIEPVSHVANGFNFAAQDIEGTGTHVLEPGANFAAQVTLSWKANR
ncbi:aldose epimerase family protein [Paraburkholderia acidisoli]|uniref:Aldose 1-epimerase n=1 Tax=Paraburkholderia acidisoli TaxID=2571748 RepID=A0A7Z2GPI0_9BURK|nr:hypothetical protein [Paraburkholderia acidisoli]QGZ65563.1 hypothetical protein FAZ98_27865 [Paraburkholderia acidisoli]